MKQLFFCLFLSVTFCLNAEEIEPPETQAQDRPKEIDSTHPETGNLPPVYSFNTVFEPMHLTVVYAEITSPVLKILKRMGESFEEGEVLMELDDKIFKGNYEKTLALVIKFKSELKAKKQLYIDDALSRFELDEGTAALKGAEADYILAQSLYKSTKIKAPYKGKVVKISVKEFELAQLGKELITLVEDEVLFAKFLVTSNLFHCLKKGMDIAIFVTETGDRIKATVSRISPIVDPSSSTIMVEAKIDNHEHRWLAGMKGRVDFIECK